MQRIVLVLIAVGFISGCSKAPSSGTSSAPVAAPSSSAVPSEAKTDAVQQKLAEFGGSSSTDCGRVGSQSDDQLKSASTCAMAAAQSKHPFYVAYDMPGMTVGVAGDADGKLYTVQAQGSANVSSGACPSQLRVAPSGRVTCFAPGDMGSMVGGVHNGMNSPTGMMNPHADGSPSAPPKHF